MTMFCPNCGKPNGDGGKFCTSCGALLVDNQSQGGFQAFAPGGGNEGYGGTGYYVDPKTQKKLDKQAKKQQKKQKQQGQSSGRKKGKGKLIAILAAAAVVVAGGGVAAYFLMNGSTQGDAAYVYLSNGSYQLLRSTKGGDPITLGTNGSTAASVTFTEDGYVYYFTQISDSTGTLCRAKYDSIKSSNASDQLEVIATNVQLYECQVFSDGRAVYISSNGALYLYNGVDTIRVADDACDLFVNEKGTAVQVIYDTNFDANDSRACYGFSLEDPTDLRQYGEGNLYLGYDQEEGVAYLTVYTEEYVSMSLLDFGETPIDLGNGSMIFSDQGSFYYAIQEEQPYSISQHLVDDYGQSDAAAAEPDLEDYAGTVYGYQQLSSDSDLSGYDQIYTSCTETVYFWHTSMELEASSTFDAQCEADCQAFLDKYADKANEDGYIVVTNEIAADLQALAESYGSHYDGEWLEFCFAYAPMDTEYDYDAYYAAMEDYASIDARNQLRQEIENGDFDQPLYTLYLYQDGNEVQVAEHVLNAQMGGSLSNALFYKTADQVENISLDQVNYDWSFYQLFAADYSTEVNCVGQGSVTPFRLSDQASDDIKTAEEGSGMYLYLAGDNLVMWETNDALSVSTIADNVASGFTILSDRALFMGLDGEGGFYYLTNLQSYDIGDLYHWEDGTSTCLATGVRSSGIQIYEDDTILAYTDTENYGYSFYYGYELQLFQKGVATAVAEGVTSYLRTDSNTILYLSDGDLYVYDGKNTTQLDTWVDQIWSSTAMPYTALSSDSYY
jgi:hypothetical protein